MNGAAAEVSLTVSAADTAIAYGSGDVPVLATPRVLALAEQAAVAAIAEHLEEGQTSVGIHAELHHVKATAVGAVVQARAEVKDVTGRGLTFEFTVTEGGETVAYGTHQRVVVARTRFPS
ncbi:MAG: hotdog domain-containing protein [Acidimicrobiia bacterium]|nr:hotdog domain-containing protein [Acidimicrobiia bacterium]